MAMTPSPDSDPMVPVPVQTTTIEGPPAAEASTPAVSDTSASARLPDAGEADEGSAAEAAAEAAPPAESNAAPATDSTAADPTPAAGGEQAAGAQTAAVQPRETAEQPARPRVATDAPVDLLTAAPARETPPPAAADSGGFFVQISSQRSPEQARASFANMQRRFPSILGSLDANIQEANLGEKGIYHRVRVGPWGTRAEAVEVCESLRAAGGDCIVPR
jgi:cell division protein FtsN